MGCVVANPLPSRSPGMAIDVPDQRAGTRREWEPADETNKPDGRRRTALGLLLTHH